MLNRDVNITIEAKHIMELVNDNHEDNHNVNESAKGQYFLKNGVHYIMYDSVDADNNMTVSNTLKIENEKISIIKKGQTKSTMHFSKGEKHKSDYITPFGTFGIETDTKDITINVEENNIDINLNYLMYLDGKISSECDMMIKIFSN